MSSTYHTPIPTSPKQPANAATFNSPLGELDAELVTQAAAIGAAEAEIDTLQAVGEVYTTGGTSTAFTLTTSVPSMALTTLEKWYVKFSATAGVTPTLNRDGKGAKSLKYYDFTGQKVACGATTIVSGMITEVIYDGVDYVVLTPIRTKGYKSYVALLTQITTGNPTPIVLENTLGESPVFTRTAQGVYSITATVFLMATTFRLIGSLSNDVNSAGYAILEEADNGIITLITYDHAGAAQDDMLVYCPIEIRVYPE